MPFEQPLTFRPIYCERVWGGRRLGELPGRSLPPGKPIGESWELSDREEAQSVVENGPHAGKTLHELWMNHREEVFGDVADSPRFPLLAKLLDARQTLSVQVHPPAAVAAELCGEPKTEMWRVLEADPGAELHAGFSQGVTRAAFESALANGQAASLLHRISVSEGDTLFIPSGRCHAIGAGCVIVEIQQNSDTTYRVFDWNRAGLDGLPRELHIPQSLRSIDFDDYEPELCGPIVECDHFRVEQWDLITEREDTEPGCVIFVVLSGAVECGEQRFERGQLFLLPAAAGDRNLRPALPGTQVMRATLPKRAV